MGLSRLSERCQKCKYVDTCNHKRMEAFAYLKELPNGAGANVAAPIMQPHDYRDVKISPDMTITIDLEELKKENFRV